MKKKYGIMVLIISLLIVLHPKIVEASEEAVPRLMQNRTDETAIHLFVKGIKEPEEITCRFGSRACSEIGWHSLTEIGETRETLVLIDNSLSTGRRYSAQIEEVVLELFENASENEQFCVATFGETTEYLTEYTNLYTPLENAVLEIEYRDRETYVTDAILDAVEQWNIKEKPAIYRRIVLISDGLESPSYLHTHEELLMKLKESGYPVYTIGCSNKDQTTLSHMAVISRVTGADTYVLSKESTPKEIALSMLEDREVLHITLVPEIEWMDGDEVNARLMFLKEGMISGLDVSAEMPFAPEQIREEQIVEPVQSGTPEPHAAVITKPVEIIPSVEESAPIGWVVGGICVMIGIAVLLPLIYWLIYRVKMKSKTEEQTANEPVEEKWMEYGDSETQLLRCGDGNDHETTLLFAEEEVYEIMLTDQSNPSKFFSIPLKDSVIIGRNARNSNVVLDYDASISGRHCEIENRSGKIFVRDLQSSNGTRVNGIKILSETELFSGNLLKLGGVEMKVGWNMHG